MTTQTIRFNIPHHFVTTCPPANHLHGTQKMTAVPGRAVIDVDCRLLPGQDADYALTHLKAAMGKSLVNHPGVSIEVMHVRAGSRSHVGSAAWNAVALAASQVLPGSEPIPVMMTGFTDLSSYREQGTDALGAFLFDPSETFQDIMGRYHGKNERISLRSLWCGTQFYALAVKALLEDPDA
eukprot:m.310000 g.310000  ORF g.310000 m.310000 type:complete len:181 (+) comp19646_c0_seq7:1016-1558(+)